MNAKFLITLFSALTANLFAVEPPTTYNNSRYYHLWQKSIVTDKPIPEEREPEKNDLEDWVLVGTRKYTDRQIVTIINTKDQSQRITVPSKEASELGFTILELKQDIGNFMRTEVQLQKGNFRGWVKYDQKFLTLKKPTPSKAQPNRGSKSPVKPGSRTRQSSPPLPGQASQDAKKPTIPKRRARVRYVPKPKK